MISSKLDGDHFATFFTLDPLNTLKLGINEQRITTARYYDSGVFNGNSISGESLSGP